MGIEASTPDMLMLKSSGCTDPVFVGSWKNTTFICRVLKVKQRLEKTVLVSKGKVTSSSGGPSSSRRSPSASVVPTPAHLLRAIVALVALEALLLTTVLVRVTSTSRPTGSSEPETQSLVQI